MTATVTIDPRDTTPTQAVDPATLPPSRQPLALSQAPQSVEVENRIRKIMWQGAGWRAKLDELGEIVQTYPNTISNRAVKLAVEYATGTHETLRERGGDILHMLSNASPHAQKVASAYIHDELAELQSNKNPSPEIIEQIDRTALLLNKVRDFLPSTKSYFQCLQDAACNEQKSLGTFATVKLVKSIIHHDNPDIRQLAEDTLFIAAQARPDLRRNILALAEPYAISGDNTSAARAWHLASQVTGRQITGKIKQLASYDVATRARIWDGYFGEFAVQDMPPSLEIQAARMTGQLLQKVSQALLRVSSQNVLKRPFWNSLSKLTASSAPKP